MSEVDFRNLLLADYRLACVSREASLLGRKEVLTGKAKFGIFGDGYWCSSCLSASNIFRRVVDSFDTGMFLSKLERRLL